MVNVTKPYSLCISCTSKEPMEFVAKNWFCQQEKSCSADRCCVLGDIGSIWFYRFLEISTKGKERNIPSSKVAWGGQMKMPRAAKLIIIWGGYLFCLIWSLQLANDPQTRFCSKIMRVFWNNKHFTQNKTPWKKGNQIAVWLVSCREGILHSMNDIRPGIRWFAGTMAQLLLLAIFDSGLIFHYFPISV